jgi:hypothetical protein
VLSEVKFRSDVANPEICSKQSFPWEFDRIRWRITSVLKRLSGPYAIARVATVRCIQQFGVSPTRRLHINDVPGRIKAKKTLANYR